MLEEGEPPSPDPALPQEEDTEEEGMAAGLTAGPQGSTPFSSVTVDFTHGGWRQLAPAPRDRFEEGMPEKSRNLVLLGLPVSQPGMNSQLEQREGSWMLERDGLRNACPDWKIISESLPEQDISEESFQDPSAEMPSGVSEHRNSELGKSLNLRPVLSPQQRVPTEVRSHKCDTHTESFGNNAASEEPYWGEAIRVQ